MSSYLRIDGPRERLDRLGPQVLSDSELDRTVENLLGDAQLSDRHTEAAHCGQSDTDLMDNIDFPGSAAAGSTLFTYLKKKLMTASSPSTRP